MIGVNLTNAKISSASFCCNLTDAIFHGAKFRHVSFEGAHLVRTDFRGADFCGEDEGARVKFIDCRFEDTIMPDGSIRSDSPRE